MSTPLQKNEAKIRSLLARIAKLGPMRPGALSVQYRNPMQRKSPFHQLSYTHKGRSRSEYVRPENLCAVRKEVGTYKKFRHLVMQLTELSLQTSRLRHKRKQPCPSTAQKCPRPKPGQ